jgi:hypothetical protein
MTTTVIKLNALSRLTMKVHAESPVPRKHKHWRIRLYDGDRVVGYVGFADLVKAQSEFENMMDEDCAKRSKSIQDSTPR